MKVLGIVGSPRKKGNTHILTQHTLKAIEEEGLETELLSISGLELQPCDGCLSCRKKLKCYIKDDFASMYEKMVEAQGIVIGAPVYTASAPALLRALIERTSQISVANGMVFKGKVGGPITVAHRTGQLFTFAELFFWFYAEGMVIPGCTVYWPIAFGSKKGDVKKDEEGLATVWDFGKNVATLLKKLSA